MQVGTLVNETPEGQRSQNFNAYARTCLLRNTCVSIVADDPGRGGGGGKGRV